MQGQRSANRLHLGVPATLALSHRQLRCLLDDISAIGARLRVQGTVTKGATARIDFHELHMFGTVVWVRGEECGVRFHTPLDPEDMQGMLWIKQNRKEYEKLTQNAHAVQWSQGIWE